MVQRSSAIFKFDPKLIDKILGNSEFTLAKAEKEIVNRKRIEAERKAKEEAERKAKEEAERKAKEEITSNSSEKTETKEEIKTEPKPNKEVDPKHKVEEVNVTGAVKKDFLDGKWRSLTELSVSIGVSNEVFEQKISHLLKERNQGQLIAEKKTEDDIIYYRFYPRESVPVETFLSKSAQERLEIVIRQYKQKLDLEFEDRVRADIKRSINNMVLPSYNKKYEEYNLVIKARKGVMTNKEYRNVLSCLHPDRVSEDLKTRYANVFNFFKGLEKALLSEKESPTEFVKLPANYSDLMKMEEEVRERRRAARRTKNSVHV
jgi:hypothetical protein